MSPGRVLTGPPDPSLQNPYFCTVLCRRSKPGSSARPFISPVQFRMELTRHQRLAEGSRLDAPAHNPPTRFAVRTAKRRDFPAVQNATGSSESGRRPLAGSEDVGPNQIRLFERHEVPACIGHLRSGGRCRRGRQVGAGRAADPIFEFAVMVHRPVVESVDYPGGQADRRIDKCCSDCVGPCEHDLAVAPVASVVRR